MSTRQRKEKGRAMVLPASPLSTRCLRLQIPLDVQKPYNISHHFNRRQQRDISCGETSRRRNT